LGQVKLKNQVAQVFKLCKLFSVGKGSAMCKAPYGKMSVLTELFGMKESF